MRGVCGASPPHTHACSRLVHCARLLAQRVAQQLHEAFDIDPAECLSVSAKTGAGEGAARWVDDFCRQTRRPPPQHTPLFPPPQGWACPRCSPRSWSASPPRWGTPLPTCACSCSMPTTMSTGERLGACMQQHVLGVSTAVHVTLDSHADAPPAAPPPSRGVVCLVEVLDGSVQKGDKITAASTGARRRPHAGTERSRGSPTLPRVRLTCRLPLFAHVCCL